MPPLILLKLADEEVKAVSQFYEDRCSMGAAFLDAADAAYVEIRRNPLAWPIVKNGFRKYKLGRFPYNAIYKIESDRIIVVAVAHQHQKPFYWRDRV
jgi:hypothetical protein